MNHNQQSPSIRSAVNPMALEASPLSGMPYGKPPMKNKQVTIMPKSNPLVHGNMEAYLRHVQDEESRGRQHMAIFCDIPARDLLAATPSLFQFIHQCQQEGITATAFIPSYPTYMRLWNPRTTPWIQTFTGGAYPWDTEYKSLDYRTEGGDWERLHAHFDRRLLHLDTHILGVYGAWASYNLRLIGENQSIFPLERTIGFTLLDTDPWVIACTKTLHSTGYANTIFLYPNITSSAMTISHWLAIVRAVTQELKLTIIMPDMREIDRDLFAALQPYVCTFPVQGPHHLLERLWSSSMYLGGESILAHLAAIACVPHISVIDRLPPGESASTVKIEDLPYRHTMERTQRNVHYQGLETRMEQHESTQPAALSIRKQYGEHASTLYQPKETFQRIRDCGSFDTKAFLSVMLSGRINTAAGH